MNVHPVADRLSKIKTSMELRYVIAVVSKACPLAKSLAIAYHEGMKDNLKRQDKAIPTLTTIISNIYNEVTTSRTIIEALMLLPGDLNKAMAANFKVEYLQQNGLEHELGIGSMVVDILAEGPTKKRKFDQGNLLKEQNGNTTEPNNTNATPRIIPRPAAEKSKTKTEVEKPRKTTKDEDKNALFRKCTLCNKPKKGHRRYRTMFGLR